MKKGNYNIQGINTLGGAGPYNGERKKKDGFQRSGSTKGSHRLLKGKGPHRIKGVKRKKARRGVRKISGKNNDGRNSQRGVNTGADQGRKKRSPGKSAHLGEKLLGID